MMVSEEEDPRANSEREYLQQSSDSQSGPVEVHPSIDGDHLSLVGFDLTSVPSELGTTYGASIRRLDLSYNVLSYLDNLDKFVKLDALVADNNDLVSEQEFPKMPTLRTLSVNNNKITDLKRFLDQVQEKCPSITYLSMLKNPACTNEITGRDGEDYQRYRLYVLSRILLPYLSYLYVFILTISSKRLVFKKRVHLIKS
eukprot:TRINITY_DN1512_c0_g1_i1.p1 TRINITY_DN1512_c0_g1~~TRINITY_DN1512_c0_g1_i1.p1  ORF type:complete len:199 (+),score=23.50 TRINITY_DN1512_c0_g1_i1:125-721(+)